MKNWKLAVVIFLLIELVAAVLFWLGGFNFDRRSPDVAFFTALSLWAGAFSAGFVLI